MSRDRIWRWWLLSGAAVVVVYYLVPRDSLANNLVYDALGLVSSALILVGIRLHRAERPALWYWFAAGQTTWVLGDLTWEYFKYVRHEEPYPSAADIFYLCAYPMLVAGLLMLARGRSGGRRDVAALVDAAIVATGLGLVFWVFVMHPIAADTTASTVERAVGVAYPVCDALLLAMLARFYTAVGRRPASIRLLGVAAVLLLVSDIGYSLVGLYSDTEQSVLDAGWLLSYVCWAAAALHPSMRDAGAVAPTPNGARVGRSRLVVLTVCSVLAPAMLFLPGIGGDEVDRITIAAGAVVLFLLVLARMSGFVGQVQAQADQLEELAMADDLTGLANRRRFEQDLHRALAAGPAAVALLDLNDFKGVNDKLGHAVGDRLLTVVGDRLRVAVPEPVLVARMGGDEFALLMPGFPGPAADATVAMLAEVLRAPVVTGDHELLVRASIGVADGTGTADPWEVLRRADVAMYAAKEGGEGHHRWTPELDLRAEEQARLGAALRVALDTGQFRVVYQPIVALPTGTTVAVEALVRWHHPERGLVSPAEFIPAAERNGLIVELGAWILRTACAQAVAWQRELGDAAPQRVSVNASARQLAEPGFAGLVATVLAETGLDPSGLTVEITETAVFGGGLAVEAVVALRALGVRVALDDFGTGHSSLTLLETVPVDVLKVDKSFVDNVTRAGRHAVIATALIQVARGLGLAAVAEGVETAEQAAELHRLGYRLAQGFYFGKPTPDAGLTAAGRPARASATPR